MTNITQEQLLQRWDNVPRDLREAMASPANNDFLWKTCQTEHLSNDKVRNIAKIAGYILLGFIHSGDFAQELKDSLSLAPQLANSLAMAINDRIFAPLKDELDKIYEPPSKLATEAPPTIEEIRRMSPTGLPVFITPSEGPRPGAPPTPMGFGVKPSAPPAPEKKPLGEFARLGLGEKPTVAPAAPAVPAPGEEPPPMMIFHEAASKTTEAASQFRAEMPVPKFGETPEAPPPHPAVIEFRGMEKPVAPPKAPERPMPKVVHYTEFRTPLGETPKPGETKPLTTPSPVKIPGGNLGGQAAPQPPKIYPLPPVSQRLPSPPSPPKVELPTFSTATDIRKPPVVPGTPDKQLNVPPPKPDMGLPELPKP